jgi:hypothetical protein
MRRRNAVSEITTRIEQYRDGELSWDDLRDWLVNRRYVDPVRYVDPQPGPTDQRDWDYLHTEGSFDEVTEARHTLLTDAEFYEVVRAINARHQAAHTPPEAGKRR